MSDPEIFANLDTDDVIKLQSALLSLFNGISSVDGRKSFFTCAGIDESFISNLDWNINISESVEILVAKSIRYRISSKNPNYHPLVKIIFYIIKQPQQRYNLEDEQINLLDRILDIGKERINLFKPKKEKYRTLLDQERQEQTEKLTLTTNNKIDKRIIVKYDLEDLEDTLKKKLAFKGTFAFSVSSPDRNILNDYIIARILDFWKDKTGRAFYKKDICISDNSSTILEDIEKELKESKTCNDILELVQNKAKLNIFIVLWNYILPPAILESKISSLFEVLEKSCLDYIEKHRQCLVFILADTNYAHNAIGFIPIKTPNEFALDGQSGLLEWFSNELSNRNFIESEIDYCVGKLKSQRGHLIGTYQILQLIVDELNQRMLNQ